MHYKGLNIDSEYAAVMTSIISLVRYCREKGVTGWEVLGNRRSFAKTSRLISMMTPTTAFKATNPNSFLSKNIHPDSHFH